MAVRDEVRDAWSYVVGGLAAGFAFAVNIPPPVALGIGAAVFGAKVLTGVFTRGGRRRSRRPQDRRLPVLTRTPEAAWLNRAHRAQETFEDVAGSARSGPIADEVATLGQETAASLGSLERLAGQASAIRGAMARLDMKQLAWERQRLLDAATPDEHPQVLAERQRSLNAVQSQLDAYNRLARTLDMLIARLESGTLAIESLVARLAEVVALAETSATAVDGTSQLDELAQELEGLRAGLVEAESVSTRAMQGLAPLPAPGPGSVPTTQQQQDRSPARRRAGGH